MKRILIYSLLAMLCLAPMWLFCQDSLSRKPSFLAYPVAYFLPETGYALGLAAGYNFYINHSDTISPPSAISFGATITQKGQSVFSVPMDFYWNKRKHSLLTEIAYSDFWLYFYGVSDFRPLSKEQFAFKRTQIRLNYLRKIHDHWYAGPRWWYEDFRVSKVGTSDLLANSEIIGNTGSITSGPGLVLLRDTRDNVFASTRGSYLELVFHHQASMWGSDFAYTRYRCDFRFFSTLRSKGVFALQAFADAVSGEVPFNQLPLVGGVKRMRGLYEGRYRDRNLVLTQAEYRQAISKRFGLTFFINQALLTQTFLEPQREDLHLSGGLGLRYYFDLEKRINLRLDAAFSKEKPIIYFTIGEAF